MTAPGPMKTTITIQGDGLVVRDFLANAAFIGPASRGVLSFSADLLANTAREIHRPNIDTQATFNSIGKDTSTSPDGIVENRGVFHVDVGPETDYSRFLEYGFVHYRSGKFIQYPFMMPAADVVTPLYFTAMEQVVEVLATRRAFTNPIAIAGAGTQLDRIRGLLYSFSKLAGDLKILGIDSQAIRRGRGLALSTSRALGDVDAVMRGAIGTRIDRRVVGHFASGGLRATVSAQLSTPSAFSTTATRIYNRISGSVAGRGLSDVP